MLMRLGAFRTTSALERIGLALEPFAGEQFMLAEGLPNQVNLALGACSVLTMAYRHLVEVRPLLTPILPGKDSLLILRRMRDHSAKEIAAHLRTAFEEAQSTIPLDLLANYLAGAQIALVQWWLEQRLPYSPEQVAQTFHRLQRAAICEAFDPGDMETRVRTA